ncbi:MAG TPA: hypothetical protein P5136_02270 [Methanofastidiosum sp.]|nr:hypothetical protein [Methanofastidiosum sp.]
MAVGLKIVSGDVVLDYSGTLQLLTSTEKCNRDIGKLLITDTEFEKPQNKTSPIYLRYNPAYGTELNNKLLYAGLSKMSIKDTVIIKLNEALSNYIKLQEKRNNLDLEEIITNINFEVIFDSINPSTLLITIHYQTLSGDDQILGQYEQEVV